MKKTLLFLLLLQSTLGFTQQIENSVLWRVSGNGLSSSSYLFGTIHIVPKKQFELNDSILSCLNKADALMLEINPDIPLKEQLAMLQSMRLPQYVTLKSYMDKTKYDLLYSYLRDSIGMKEKKLDRYMQFKPILFQSAVFREFVDNPKSYERELYKVGKNKKFIALETIEQQLGFMDSIPIEKFMDFSGDDYKLDKEYFKLLSLYQNQDMESIKSLTFEDPNNLEFDYYLLEKRNHAWVPLIESAMKNQSTFIGVGCAHLLGEVGLIQLLRTKGYTVSPIIFTFNKK